MFFIPVNQGVAILLLLYTANENTKVQDKMPSCCFCGRWQVSKAKNGGLTFHKYSKTLYPEILVSLDQCDQSVDSSTERNIKVSNTASDPKNEESDYNADLLSDCFGKKKFLISSLAKKNAGKKLPRKYSTEFRRFALSLHFHSDASPGFTKESLDMLSLKSKNIDHSIYCALVLGEMAIRKHIEWDGSSYHGYVNFGTDLDSDKLNIANEYLVFMLVAINERWKLPVGYLVCKHPNTIQKSNLLAQCLNLVTKTGVVVVVKDFQNAGATVKVFLNMFNYAFDTLNSRSLDCYGFKKALCVNYLEAIRSHGEYINNPTTRQFRSSYRKLIIHATIRDGGLGNCIPRDKIEQLHLQDYIANTNSLSPISEEAIIYKAEFVAHKLQSKIKCDICVSALFGEKNCFLNSLIHLRDKDGFYVRCKEYKSRCPATGSISTNMNDNEFQIKKRT
ncbi:Uncharacterized protein FWK35_00018696 [Aphis craccivora]|uniref:THAP-type domain-containing protein n=1 Tax=Aphis craccivora TaxID=307492 RepID=A0A6G0Y125_APHCR|nr:Uncharacterized protein FWK35_00018696 [Aphis craccivora]